MPANVSPSMAELLALAFKRLDGDSALRTLLGGPGRVGNYLPQDSTLPLVRVRLQSSQEWDTKTSAGWATLIAVDAWDNSRGDLKVHQIADRIDALLHEQNFAMTTGQSLILRHSSSAIFLEPDGITHHAALQFDHIATG